jgi:hypothetical protein
MQNAHVHPALAGILNQFAAIPACATAANDATQRMVKCSVTVTAADLHETFSGLYPSTCDAVIAATEHFGQRATVSVRSVQ